MSEDLKTLCDVDWLKIGSTDNYADLKKWIAHICHDITHASVIDEICINDICVGFRMYGYEVVADNDLVSLRAELEAAKAQRWIPVSEQYPPEWKRVIVKLTDGLICTGGYWSGYQWSNDIVGVCEAPTHWMSFPDATQDARTAPEK